MPSSERLASLNNKTLIVSLGAVIASIVLSIDFGIPESSFWRQIQSSISTTFLSVGLLGLIFEIGLRREVQNEMMQLTGIEKSVSQNFVLKVGEIDDSDWKDVIAGSTTFKFVLMRPQEKFGEFWHEIQRSCNQQRIEVEIFIPNPDAAYIVTLANALKTTEDNLKSEISEFVRACEQRWSACDQNSTFSTGSKISIKYSQLMPLYSLYSFNKSIVLAIEGPFSRSYNSFPFNIVFQNKLGSPGQSKVSEQLTEPNVAGCPFEKEIRS